MRVSNVSRSILLSKNSCNELPSPPLNAFAPDKLNRSDTAKAEAFEAVNVTQSVFPAARKLRFGVRLCGRRAPLSAHGRLRMQNSTRGFPRGATSSGERQRSFTEKKAHQTVRKTTLAHLKDLKH
jgi:hypothetical protein